MSMQSGFYADHLPDLVATGEVPEAMLDDSVRRVLNIKNAVGLFDDPYRSLDAARETADATRDDHAALAREAARRSIVMLKNDGDVLPLGKSGQRIALIGPFARDRQNLEGCWTLFGDAARHVTLEDGLRQAMDDASMLAVEPGCDFETELPGGFAAAIAAAEAADVVLLAIGEPQVYSGEAQSRTQIVVPAVQQALAEAIASTGKPVVVLLRNGRALALHGAVRDAQAILVTWFLGSQTGPGVADVVFGDHSPSARLPVSFPQDSGQQPYYYNHRRTGRPELAGQPHAFKSRWREFTNEALYPFGHGLGYARFAYATPTLNTARLGWNDALTIRCKVSNLGERDAEETVQLYIHDKVASRVRPVRELKGFAKVEIPAGSTREVEFALTRHDLAFAGADARPVAEAGVFQLWVSPSSTTGEPVEFELLAP
jgi:beta-glucosidase